MDEPAPQIAQEVHVPLRSVKINSILEGIMATTDIQMTYTNGHNNPIECTYEFPLEKTTLLSKLVITIGGQTITAKVDKKASAKETYDEAIKAKNTAVLAER